MGGEVEDQREYFVPAVLAVIGVLLFVHGFRRYR